LRKLGIISYSTYLSHVPIIVICQYFILKFYPSPGKNEMLIILTAFAVPLIIIVSLVLHSAVEKPFINLGRRIAERQRSG